MYCWPLASGTNDRLSIRCGHLTRAMKPGLFSTLIANSALFCSAHSYAQCPGETELGDLLEQSFPLLAFSVNGERCAQITQGDFNADGKLDTAAVLTESSPTSRYRSGDPHFRTYISVFLSADVAKDDYALVVVRTDGNAPQHFSVSAVPTGTGHDLVVEARDYSRTRYSWRDAGFVSIEHVADGSCQIGPCSPSL